MKNEEVIQRILAYHPQLENYSGCDEVKAGDRNAECKGIAVALVPTADVIRRAAAEGCNLLITHEPIFFQTPDYPEWKGAFSNPVYEEKKKLLEETGMTVWRDHDHMHAHVPDSIFSGVLKCLGWEQYQVKIEKNAALVYGVELPEAMTVKQLGHYLIDQIGLNGTRYIGREDAPVKRILIAAHLYPNSFGTDGMKTDGFYHDYGMDVMEIMEKENYDALIPGEIIEWTILSYIRDAVALGKNRSCFNIGHFALEELGMKAFAEQVRRLTDGKTPVTYLPTKEAFSYLL